MKVKCGVLLLGIALAATARSWATTLPDACGNDAVKYEVTTHEGPAPPAAPAEGKAQVVLLENENQMIGPFMHATVRFGIDGTWVGATKGSSYFWTDVAPGIHHLCASWQSSLHQTKKNVDLTSFTAEPGKVYYFSAHVTVASQYSVLFGLSQLNPDQGKYRVGISKLAKSKPK